MKELPSAGPQEGSDVLEVWGGTRSSTKRRRIERAAPRGEENEACDTGPDLEPSGVEVPVRNAVAREVQNRPEKECCEPRTGGGAGRSACRNVEGDDHGADLAECPRPIEAASAVHLTRGFENSQVRFHPRPRVSSAHGRR
jgi:hypothetical protein